MPASDVLGELGQGLEIARAELNSLRLECCAVNLGTAKRALDMAKTYAKQRVTFGEPLARRQHIQQMIVLGEIDIFASKLMLYNTAAEVNQGENITLKAMMVKCFVTEMAIRFIDRAMQIYGGLGYSKDLPLEMMYRDARIFTIGDGPTEIMEWTIARNLLRK
ncbi:acyl-CoA dehydrogenase family protein [Chloroflexota bacterium]